MKNIQQKAEVFQKEMGWEIPDHTYLETRAELLNNYMLLTTEVAEVGEEFRKAFNQTNASIRQGISEQDAFQSARIEIKEDVGKELADCLAYIMKIANYFEIDLEESFSAKMEIVKNRKNKDV